jgi:hypothetical protein
VLLHAAERDPASFIIIIVASLSFAHSHWSWVASFFDHRVTLQQYVAIGKAASRFQGSE